MLLSISHNQDSISTLQNKSVTVWKWQQPSQPSNVMLSVSRSSCMFTRNWVVSDDFAPEGPVSVLALADEVCCCKARF